MRRVICGGLLTGLLFLSADGSAQEQGKKGAFKQGGDPKAAFALIDKNKNGKVTKEEFSAFFESLPQFKEKQGAGEFLFRLADKNGDGFVTEAEFVEFNAAMQAKGKEDKGEMKKGGFLEKFKKKDKSPQGDVKETNPNPSPEQIAFFEKKIRPVLVENCYSCHSTEAKKEKGNLLVDSKAGLRKGGDSGPAVVPGDNKSLLLKAIRHESADQSMPPKKKLSDAVIADFEAWVKMGAPDPRGGAATTTAPKNDIDIEKGRQFWAFQLPKAIPAPSVKNAAWPANDIDRHLLAKLEAKGLKPIGDADKATLLRRVTLDLIGLPPTPAELEAFLKDAAPNAFEKVVDRLLASPHFGERWGRHWLDVARYGESTGKTVNANYPNAWRYRDYVIAAFNADKPYDVFIKEQLAGDLLPAKDDKQKAERIVATGFLAIGTKTLNERNPQQFQMDLADEQIDATSQAFLGITAACARCHDHKFDPIPTKDYYALAGIFRSSETCYGTLRQIQAAQPSPTIPLPPGSVASIAPLPKAERDNLEAEVKRIKDELAEMNKKDARASFLSMNGVRLNIQLSQAESKLAAYNADGSPKAVAMGVRDRGRPIDMPVLHRGEIDKPGEVVHRGVLQVVSKDMPTIRTGSGRKELAEWIASEKNPLTARVMVNRVWLHLFGRGLVPTADNFGGAGQPPSHPELLDTLAIQFAKDGWSVKKLIKSMVLSHAYRLDSKNSQEHFDVDPDNVLVWRMAPRKLDAEALRDSILAVSGQLDATPPVGSTVATFGEGLSGTLVRQTQNLDGNSRHRSVYMTILRDNLPESLSLFDAADPSLVVAERSTTNVPSQGLFLLNNPWVMRMAESAGKEIYESAKTDEERVKNAYVKFFGREPGESEKATAIEFARKFQAKNSGAPTAAKDAPQPKGKGLLGKGPLGKGAFGGMGQDTRPMGVWSAFAQALFASAEFQYRR